MRRLSLWFVVFTSGFIFQNASLLADPVTKSSSIQLSSECPPGFEQVKGRCYLRNLYRLYDSLQNSGVGGLKTGLPEIREGFTPRQIDLGRYLFYDPVLSADGSVSCGSCHHPDFGFGDGKDRSIGVTGEKVKRSAPSLWNVGFLERLFWDARAATLEEQLQGPLYAPDEMGNNEIQLLDTLNANQDYRRLFEETFHVSPITPAQVYLAIAAFEASLISLNSRYDQYAHGYHDALSHDEIEGLNIFRSFVARCAECHTPPLFTNQEIAIIGTPEPDGLPFDPGEGGLTNEPTQRGGFKVPSLRNIANTAPYMHSGKFENLREAVSFYTKGRGHAVPENEDLSIHWHIWEPDLSDQELDLLVTFLKTLNDESLEPQIPNRVPSGLVPVGKLPGDTRQESES
ncbi:MAG TPA: cytochrome c peroxidase [Pseudomonadales bacterium]|jgi:cytochrome c peroxidase|nr:cytochrome-c peroxidase [Gammaproteobacteria bacterium]MDP6025249.1 cytochrome c peroxidase [Pseudomonadales bacterium]MDP6315308.1 cytochrome c peroxidase [Pseudomonadales bacterium]MDP7314756.1 cytochrome c peroxidase [Pseudomonadales bacterium]HJL60382.1 cytochrome c peroxidase [Pseudomonadales bacterium]|tara:strand:- start:25071 stop:26270 length:1200 start_codon:yes stop_codon:yes gene_type:complete